MASSLALVKYSSKICSTSYMHISLQLLTSLVLLTYVCGSSHVTTNGLVLPSSLVPTITTSNLYDSTFCKYENLNTKTEDDQRKLRSLYITNSHKSISSGTWLTRYITIPLNRFIAKLLWKLLTLQTRGRIVKTNSSVEYVHALSTTLKLMYIKSEVNY